VWITGTDPLRHKQYRVWLQQKNQAQYRQEGWAIDFDTWVNMWGDNWDRRGREKGTYCMTRVDWCLPWRPDNVRIVPREVHARMQAHAIKCGWTSPARKLQKQRKQDDTCDE
jgi:hypothetical protein